MVCFAWQLPNSMVFTETKMFSGDRATIRKQACHHALEKLLAFCVKQ
jgi:nicotinamide mononucleotide (NMN) deamidase PncC